MQKKVIQKRNILIVFASILLGIVFVSGVMAASIGDFKHYEDKAMDWKGGIINAGQSGYREDEVLPHFAQFTDLKGGTNYYFYIFMDYYLNSKNACGFDKLYQYDYTTRITPILTAGLATPNYFPGIAGPPFSNLGDFGGEGNLYYGGDTLTSISLAEGAFSGVYPADQQANIMVQFTTSGITTTIIDEVVFYWGQHIAVGDTGGSDNCPDGSLGASDWAGGGLRTKLQNADGAGHFPPGDTPLPESGAIQIMPGAIQPPTFEGYKWFDPNGNGQWDVNGTTTLCDNPPNPNINPSPPPPDFPCEAPLQYWLMYLEKCTSADPNSCTVDPMYFDFDITDSDGYYAVFAPLDSNYDFVPGYYRVCEDISGQNPKWENTYPHPYATTNPVCHPVEHVVDISVHFSDVNFGNWWGTTAVELSGFTANPDNDNKVALLVEWQTAMQTDTLGFNLYRSRYEDGSKRKLLAYLDLDFDGEYEYLDKKVGRGKTYYYWLEAFYTSGPTDEFGSIEGTVPKRSK